MKQYTMTSQGSVRDAFWNLYTEFQGDYKARKRQNDYNALIRSVFCEFVDDLQKSGQISEALARRVTL